MFTSHLFFFNFVDFRSYEGNVPSTTMWTCMAQRWDKFSVLPYFTRRSGVGIIRSTSESRPNSIEGKNVRPPVRPSVRPSVHKKFLQFE